MQIFQAFLVIQDDVLICIKSSGISSTSSSLCVQLEVDSIQVVSTIGMWCLRAEQTNKNKANFVLFN